MGQLQPLTLQAWGGDTEPPPAYCAIDAITRRQAETWSCVLEAWIYYEIDQEEVKTVLRLKDYECDGDEDSSWVLLEEVDVHAEAGPSGVSAGAEHA